VGKLQERGSISLKNKITSITMNKNKNKINSETKFFHLREQRNVTKKFPFFAFFKSSSLISFIFFYWLITIVQIFRKENRNFYFIKFGIYFIGFFLKAI
jgi:hypothetical protein